eukprot:9657678-Alexandrium_andersonii.AAC.1
MLRGGEWKDDNVLQNQDLYQRVAEDMQRGDELIRDSEDLLRDSESTLQDNEEILRHFRTLRGTQATESAQRNEVTLQATLQESYEEV